MIGLKITLPYWKGDGLFQDHWKQTLLLCLYMDFKH